MRALLWLVTTLVVAPVAAHAAVGGRYDTPLGPVDVKVNKGQVTATSLGEGGPCAFKKGQTILKAKTFDDSVSGKLSLCTESCGPKEAFVVLLVAQNGDLLSGAIQLKEKECKLPLQGKGIAFARAKGGKGQPMAKAARVKKKDPPAQNPDNNNAASKGKDPASKGQQANTTNTSTGTQQQASPSSDDPPPVTNVKAADVSTPFSNWNPEAASRGGGEGGRKVALMRAREAERLLNSGQFEAARPLLMEALQADPGYAEGYNMMGVTFYARDNYDVALDWYKKALTANPDFGDAYYNIACIYSVELKKPLALKYLRIALLNGYTQKEAILKDPDLDPLRDDAEYKEILSLLDPPPAAPAPTPAPEGAASSSAAPPAGAPDAAVP